MIILVSDGMSFDLTSGQDVQLAKDLAADRHRGVRRARGRRRPAGRDRQRHGPDRRRGVSRRGHRGRQSRSSAASTRCNRRRLERTLPEPQDNFFPYCVAGLVGRRSVRGRPVRLEVHAMVAELAAIVVGAADGRRRGAAHAPHVPRGEVGFRSRRQAAAVGSAGAAVARGQLVGRHLGVGDADARRAQGAPGRGARQERAAAPGLAVGRFAQHAAWKTPGRRRKNRAARAWRRS